MIGLRLRWRAMSAGSDMYSHIVNQKANPNARKPKMGEMISLNEHPQGLSLVKDLHMPALSGCGFPVFLAHAIRFKVGVFSARKLRPIQSETFPNHFRAQVAAIRQKTGCNKAVIRKFRLDLSRNFLALAKLDQFPFCLFTPGVLELWRINSRQSQSHFAYLYRVSVDHIAFAR